MITTTKLHAATETMPMTCVATTIRLITDGGHAMHAAATPALSMAAAHCVLFAGKSPKRHAAQTGEARAHWSVAPWQFDTSVVGHARTTDSSAPRTTLSPKS
jgi:hypothetical protein